MLSGYWAWVLGGSRQAHLVSVTEDGLEGPSAALLSDAEASSDAPHPDLQVIRILRGL